MHASACLGVGALLLLLSAGPTSALIEDILDVIKLSKEVTSSLLETWEIIEQTHAVNEVDIPFYKVKEKKILSRMAELTRQIDYVESEVGISLAKSDYQTNVPPCSPAVASPGRSTRSTRT